MAAAAASFLSRFTHLSTSHHQSPPYSRHLLIRPLPPSFSPTIASIKPPPIINCLISGVDGGGVSDDFVSTRSSISFDRQFSVIANMLKKIEPLDTSVISKGVSDAAKDSMKQTISTMLGLLPSDQFTVMVRFSKNPLDRLLSSSLITGYTLWNAEYRMMLMRNFEISPSSDSERLKFCEISEEKVEESECSCDSLITECCTEDSERLNLQSCLGDLPPEAMAYIRKLESELSAVKKVNELSRPSSSEVEEVIRELVQCTSRRFFKEETTTDSSVDIKTGTQENLPNDYDYFSDTIGTSRDYLAKLLFWCMLLGHHLRGLENRLHLSCAVGLL